MGENEDFISGALPPSGFYPIVYGVNYSVDKLVDDELDGKTIPDNKGQRLSYGPAVIVHLQEYVFQHPTSV